MSRTVRHSSRPDVSMMGVVSVIMSLLALLSVGWLALLTYSPAGGLDPSNLVRALGAAFLPIGLAVGIPAGLAALRYPDVNRVTGIVGLLLAAATVAALVLLLTSIDY